MKTATNIVLVGPMGAGKTTVGKRLALMRQMPFVDSDHEIERRSGVDIPLIFEKEGEAGFRRRESAVIDELLERDGMVLATGGGAILDPLNRLRMSTRSVVIYLHASVAQQLMRTSRSSSRPLLRNAVDRRAVLQSLFEVRHPLYRDTADLTVCTDGRNARQLTHDIEQQLLRAGWLSPPPQETFTCPPESSASI